VQTAISTSRRRILISTFIERHILHDLAGSC
jgi:hypothetical protein